MSDGELKIAMVYLKTVTHANANSIHLHTFGMH